jgi:hypothetical protein
VKYFSNQFYGSTASTKFDSRVIDLRHKVELCMRKRDILSFLPIVSLGIQYLQSLPPSHPYYLPTTDLHLGQTPFSALLDDTMSIIFIKVCDVSGYFADPNNNSGFAIGGPKGCGKTNVIKLAIILASVLFPNIVSVYSNYQSTFDTPTRLLYNAMRLQDPNFHIDVDRTTIIKFQDLLYLQKKLILFGGDEISLAYNREDLSGLVHTDLATLVTGYFAVVLIADSSVRLREVVAGTFNNHGKYSRGSLNSSKLRFKILDPLTKLSHYTGRKGYLEHMKNEYFPQLKFLDDINGLHTITGGRYRLIKEYQNLVGFMNTLFAKFPPADTVEYVVLDFLVKEQIKLMCRTGKQFNPFELVEVQERQLVQVLKQNHELASWKAMTEWIDDLQDSEIVRCIYSNFKETTYTFAVPYHFLRMNNWNPRVFISHAITDNNSSSYIKLLQQLESVGAVIGVCEDGDSKSVASQIGLAAWMKGEIESEANSFVLVYLTPQFHKSVIDKRGCFTELHAISQKLHGNPAFLEKLIFMYDGSFSEWNQRFQSPEYDILMLNKFTDKYFYKVEDVNSIVSHLVGQYNSGAI